MAERRTTVKAPKGAPAKGAPTVPPTAPVADRAGTDAPPRAATPPAAAPAGIISPHNRAAISAPPSRPPAYPSVREIEAQREAALTAQVEQSVADAAKSLGLNHARVLSGLLDVAEHPYSTGSEKVAAWKALGDAIGTAKAQAPVVHNHLHAVLASAPMERLVDRLAHLIGNRA